MSDQTAGVEQGDQSRDADQEGDGQVTSRLTGRPVVRRRDLPFACHGQRGPVSK